MATAPPIVADSRLAKSTGAPRPASRLRLPCRQRHAGAGRDLHRVAVDAPELVEPDRREHNRCVAVGAWHAAADESGVAALRHDAHALRLAASEHSAHLVGRAGPHDHRRRALEPACPVRLERGQAVAIGDDVRPTDDVGELADERVAHG